MSTYRERIERYERVDRTVKLAVTYLRKASVFLNPDEAETPSSYWGLLDQSIETATDIVDALPNSFFESTVIGDPFGLVSAMHGDPRSRHNLSDDPLEKARALVAALERRREREQVLRRIAQLENVEGRTPGEAEVFLARAARMRAELEAEP